MLARKSLIISLVRFLSYCSNVYISKKRLEYAVDDMINEIEGSKFSDKEKRKIMRILSEKPEFLLDKRCKYFRKMKYAILPFLIHEREAEFLLSEKYQHFRIF